MAGLHRSHFYVGSPMSSFRWITETARVPESFNLLITKHECQGIEWRNLLNLCFGRRNSARNNVLGFLELTLFRCTTKLKVEARNATSSDVGGKDENLVFVAGATGKVGSRTLR
ncbi:uncharacterized protein [Primulina huaijiensis]|uniref:uncharacterized protein n=1 Tax=Primulina huaijiensis TaxID=1492673 RepID=UPI003CC758A5